MKKYIVYLFSIILFSSFAFSQNAGYMKNDLHQHTTFTDGWYSLPTMMFMSDKYGLDFWVNSEHGGSFARDGFGPLTTTSSFTKDTAWNQAVDSRWWDSYSPNPIKGTPSFGKNKHQRMWRWQSIKEYSFPQICEERKKYPSKIILQGLEWNMPGHDHCSMAILNNQFHKSPNANPVAEFEYKFDAIDYDTLGKNENGWIKSKESKHDKAVAAAKWLQTNYPKTSWLILNHTERQSKYKIEDIRDLNDTAPDVCFGFEEIPGHQKSADRGDYKFSHSTDGNSLYGGAGIYLAEIGGFWDALLGEGRNWWVFTNSDCHSVGKEPDMKDGEDFWPGEYQKNYTYVADKSNPFTIPDGLRSGNTWIVTGDLIDSLDFSINSYVMGQWATPVNNELVITIKVRDPETKNNNTYTDYNNPVLDHIDLIAGIVTGKTKKGTPEYSLNTNSSTKVVARFDSKGGIVDYNGLLSKKWDDKGNGWKEMSFTLSNITNRMYFRLRGTNLPSNVKHETDPAGNPMTDEIYRNNYEMAFHDLWFYSNPIFVKMK